MSPVAVAAVDCESVLSATVAMPKSAITICPASSTSTFEGLRSRTTICIACSSASALAICRPAETACSTGIGARRESSLGSRRSSSMCASEPW